jgi:outer membrane protein assembly factor BamB
MQVRTLLAIGVSTALLALSMTVAGSSASATRHHWPAGGSALTSTTDWPGYLHGSDHSAYNPADASITSGNVAQVAMKWHWAGDAPTMPGQPTAALYASPTVADGYVYIGAKNGYFYQLDEVTGAALHKVFLGFSQKLTCNPQGIIATATVAVDPADGKDTVYIAGPDGYLYALDAMDLSTKWRSVIDIPSTTVNDYFQWSSPTVANGKIYVGSASQCDKPLTRGALVSFDQGTGTEISRFFTVPDGSLGGGVWSSAAVADDGTVYISTGTPPRKPADHADSVSIVKLDGTTLQKLGSYRVPDTNLCGDCDFGGSPTVFGSMVGACNKNGIYYALDRATMTLAWQRTIGALDGSATSPCLSAAAYDGTSLYIGGNLTVVNGTSYQGSLRRLDPATGAVQWELGLPNPVLTTPTLNGAGVLALGTDGGRTGTPNAVYLVDASTGTILRTLSSGGRTFAQSVFANGYLFTANIGKRLAAYHLR